MIAASEKAPLFSATAVFSARRFDLETWRGTPVLIAFVDHRSAFQMRSITAALRGVYPRHQSLLIVTVADMHVVPRLMRGVARTIMEKAYQEAAKEIPDGVDAADHLIILPDWEARVCYAYGITDVGREPALVLVDVNGRVHATYQGPDPAAAAVDMAARLFEL